jgi:hypothetical protein
MTPWIEWTLCGVAGGVIVAIFVTEALRARGLTFATLPAPMIFFLRITLGIIFAILGVIGSLLPIMQGWLFFLLAILVLFPQSRFAIAACNKVERKMPRMVARLRRWGIGVPRPSSDDNDDEAIRPRVL